MKDDDIDLEILQGVLDSLPIDMKEALMEAAMQAESPEEFAGWVMVGPCPRCGNESTLDGMDVAENEKHGDPTMGVCPECDFQWCIDCGQESDGNECPHWQAWDAHCRKLGIYQNEESLASEEFNKDYAKWLEAYIADRDGSDTGDKLLYFDK